MALQQAIQLVDPTVAMECVAALDHSDLCLSVYQYNHHGRVDHGSTNGLDVGACRCPSQKPKVVSAVRIQELTIQQVQQWDAEIFFMSPPCQPHSRQHTNQEQDLQDPRSESFLHLCAILQELPVESLPRLLFLENVIGFESSNSCQRWRKVLAERQYHVAHFHLQPIQVGIPNDRPRYFCLAVLIGSSPAGRRETSPRACGVLSKFEHYLRNEVELINTTGHALESKGIDTMELHTNLNELNVFQTEGESTLSMICNYLDPSIAPIRGEEVPEALRIPDKVIQSPTAWCLDIVTPEHQRTSCFTSSYGKFVRGTGSVLYLGKPTPGIELVEPHERQFDPHWSVGLDWTKMRYFSGMEIARLLGFPPSFEFPLTLVPSSNGSWWVTH